LRVRWLAKSGMHLRRDYKFSTFKTHNGSSYWLHSFVYIYRANPLP
jgi:hypothetical protein